MSSTPSVTSAKRIAKGLGIAVVAAGAMIGPQSIGVAAAAPNPACADVEVVFARGTFEAPGVGDTGQAFVNALESRLPGRTVDVYAVNYPASLDFQAAANGVVDATNRIQSVAASCPTTDIVLGGYSQGAAVAGYSTFDAVPAGLPLPAGLGPMPPAVAQHVDAVVLFGTPDNWFLDLVDRNAPPITVGSQYSGKTLQLCAPGDPVCFPGGFDRAAHSSYKSNGMAVQAADYAASRLTTASTPAV